MEDLALFIVGVVFIFLILGGIIALLQTHLKNTPEMEERIEAKRGTAEEAMYGFDLFDNQNM